MPTTRPSDPIFLVVLMVGDEASVSGRVIDLGAVAPFSPPEEIDGFTAYASAVLRGGRRRLSNLEEPNMKAEVFGRVAEALYGKLRMAKALREA